MSPRPFVPPPASRLVVISLVALVCCFASFAQQPKILAPHKHVAPKVDHRKEWSPSMKSQSAVGGTWTTEPNWKSQLFLKNSLKADPLTVRP